MINRDELELAEGVNIRRTPDEYEEWINGTSKECEKLELKILEELDTQGKPVFVDTNVSVDTLKKVAVHDHVLIMLAYDRFLNSGFQVILYNNSPDNTASQNDILENICLQLSFSPV